LFSTTISGKFTPLWSKKELNEAIKNNLHIKRYKGLGEFSPEKLSEFTLNKNIRKLIKVEWSNNVESLFLLMTSAEEKRKLILNQWSIGEIDDKTQK
jgi:DNA gyrase/topoisomerase IV subunit B